MAGERTPGPTCQVERAVCVQDGTMCIAPSPAPGPVGRACSKASPPKSGELASGKVIQSVSISIGAETTWDAAIRELYTRASQALRAQGQEFVLTGKMTMDEAKLWVNGQRNALIMASRDKSSPIGRAVAEWIKPQNKLKTVSELEKLGKTAEGIIESSGKTNPWVNRVTVGFRYGGPALIIVGIGFSAYNIAAAPEHQHWRVAGREAGSWGGALAVGWTGGVAGCEFFGALGTVAPIIGNLGGCAAGAIIGTLGGAILGGRVGSQAAEFLYRSLDSSAPSMARSGGAGR